MAPSEAMIEILRRRIRTFRQQHQHQKPRKNFTFESALPNLPATAAKPCAGGRPQAGKTGRSAALCAALRSQRLKKECETAFG
jgi:hypothetical protein